jgi:alkanesulfonate monooxygenase SsuD/methylene tetrahydromethanopterin reductase-like flavin-dependent oxidoreductase (luciferase family)
MVRYGIALPQVGFEGFPPDVAEIADFAREAEESGFDSLWALEALTHRLPVLEPLQLLASVATVTKRVGLGVAVIVLPLRSPLPLAAELSTLDVLSRGRLVPAFGLGDREYEYRLTDADWDRRGAHLEEQLALLRRLLMNPAGSQASRSVGMEAPVTPGPFRSRALPLILSAGEVTTQGGSPGIRKRVADRIARLADGWIAGGEMTLEGFRSAVRQVRSGIHRHGRESSQFLIGKRIYVNVGESMDLLHKEAEGRLTSFYGKPMVVEGRCLVGSGAQIIEGLGPYQELGPDLLILHPLANERSSLRALAESLPQQS